MKNLYIIRHAKSSWEFNIEDHKRPLNDRGLRDAKLIGEELKSKQIPIDKVVCSDAVRAKSTAAIILKDLGVPKSRFYLDTKMYDFTGTKVMEVIKECEDTVDTLMIFGHNFGLTDIVNKLSDVTLDNLPTAGVIGIQFESTSWKTITTGTCMLTLFPKQLL